MTFHKHSEGAPGPSLLGTGETHDLDRPDGDVLEMTDSVMGSWTYTYDDFNQLTSGTASAGVDAGLDLGWTYDRYGNLLYDGRNTYAYDAEGVSVSFWPSSVDG